MKFFLCALGLAFILEGIPYFLFAERMPLVLRMLVEKPPSVLRKIGIGALVTGMILIFLGKNLS